MRVTVKPIVNGVLGMVPKCLEESLEKLEIKGKTETIHTKILLRSVRIFSIVLENPEDLLSFRPQWKTPVKDHQQTLVWKTHQA